MTTRNPEFFGSGGEEGLDETIQQELDKFALRGKTLSVPLEYDFNNFMFQVCHKLWKSNQEYYRINPDYASETANFSAPNFLSEKLKSLTKGQYYDLVDQTAKDLGIYEELESIIKRMHQPNILREEYLGLRADLNSRLKELYVRLRKQGFNSYDLEES